jgi:hypothetical protein
MLDGALVAVGGGLGLGPSGRYVSQVDSRVDFTGRVLRNVT